jgi:hypothetical protein
MRLGTTVLTTSALVLALSVPCLAQVIEIPTQTTTIAGTIQTIDHNRRAMNIMIADGRDVALTVPWTVERFNQLKVGDRVSATYNNNVSVRLKPAGEPAVVDDSERLPIVQGPTSGKQEIVRKMTATIVAIDRGASSIAFAAPDGEKYTRHVVDPTVFDQVHMGDRVDIVWNTELTIARE